MQSYLSQKDHIFRNVELLIYVFDVESRETAKDMQYYHACLNAIRSSSKGAKVFCLVHKMDLVPESQKKMIFEQKTKEILQRSLPWEVTCFSTTIWDESLYKAWSSIVYTLIPNIKILEKKLATLCDICEADEVLLFERATFLVITTFQSSNAAADNLHRSEKLSNIIKQFKLSCGKCQGGFQSMELKHPQFTAFIDILTKNTYIMLVFRDTTIESAVTLTNIAIARQTFEASMEGKK